MLGGFYLRFGDKLDRAVNRRVHETARLILENPLPAVTDVIPGYSTLYLEYDATKTSEPELRCLLETLRAEVPGEAPPAGRRRLTVTVVYDGPDLENVAERTGLSVGEVIERHSARDYYVYAVGFTPGLAFMGELDPLLRLPRRSAPRRQVEAGRVAIADRQTTVYPVASPGGWHLLGRTVEAVYTPTAEHPILFEAGDRVRFQAVKDVRSKTAVETRLELLPESPGQPLLRVEEPGLLDLIVDRGRFRAGRYGFARSGPLDAAGAARANRLVGNEAGAALLELNVQGGVYKVLADGVLAFTGGGMRAQLGGREIVTDSSFAVRAGERLSFAAHATGSRGYLALAGGVESGTFMGSASVDLRGRIGRPLGAGDALGTATPRPVRAGRTYKPYSRDGALRLVPGPQASPEALEALIKQIFAVGRADRMGVHLLGGAVPGGEVLSEAAPLGSVQVPPGGLPILLLHDRGTLGGYHKPAVLHPADLGRAAQLRPGQRVRFKMAR